MAHWLVIGCGYTGTAVAAELVRRGDQVVVSRRAAVAAERAAVALGGGARGIAIDLADPGTLAGAVADGAVADGAVVVCCAPPGAEPAAEVHALVTACARGRRFVYVSSTGVYGRGDGAVVDEHAPIAPLTASGRARAIAETAVVAACADAGLSSIVLRVAGIYGPGRGMLDRLRAGTYRVIGDGHAHVSRIHVDDLVAAILAAGDRTTTGAVNVADDDPAPIGLVADALAASLGLPPPARVPADSVSAEIAGMLTADRRIANRRLRDELGVTLRHPSWRGLLAPR